MKLQLCLVLLVICIFFVDNIKLRIIKLLFLRSRQLILCGKLAGKKNEDSRLSVSRFVSM